MQLRASIVGFALLACGAEVPPPTAHVTREVTQMLERSAAAWNRGDLDAFVADYAADTRTGFVADGRVHYGFDWIRSRYAPAFAPAADRDSLRFEDVAARPLGPRHALATARFVLERSDSVTASGPFTLILERHDTEWKIVHDHTSHDPR